MGKYVRFGIFGLAAFSYGGRFGIIVIFKLLSAKLQIGGYMHNPPIYPAPDNPGAGSARERSDSGRPARTIFFTREMFAQGLKIVRKIVLGGKNC